MTDCDLVYSWVNPADQSWRRLRAEYDGDREGLSRYTERRELLYSLRSVSMYARGFRRVFIVTPGHAPGWLDRRAATVVNQNDLIGEFSPTFSSNVVESFLHRIPGLAEHFVYLNDDFFLTAPVTPDSFFSPLQRLRCIPAPTTLRERYGRWSASPTVAPFVFGLMNAEAVCEHLTGSVPLPSIDITHTPQPMTVGLCETLWREAADALAAACGSRFRGPRTIDFLRLSALYGIATGAAANEGCDDHVYVEQFKSLLSVPPLRRDLCVNHVDNVSGFAQFMNYLYPVRSDFERNTGAIRML